ncbi:uncharacterized protein LOC125077721 isoform X2 [Vanessa atalanta]|uniref:uncharacterized protein LOC125077721 isoform X2 n=1 Tax=Vanessa atalanta TaxID=42275 RepID=UPI001FCCEB25|nr:uncharacterized protein LOC125077721 isoform X2 [Vanessa atalanta]
MKIFVLLVFIAVLSDQICAYPAADDAAKDAVKDASTPAVDAVKDKNPLKGHGPSVPGLDNLSKMTSILNPADMISKGKGVMDTLMKPLMSPLSGVESMLKPHDKDVHPPSSDAASKSANKAENKNPLQTAEAFGTSLFGSFFG